MADEIVRKRIKDDAKTLTLAQFLASYVLGDSTAEGTGKFLIGDAFVNAGKVLISGTDAEAGYLYDKMKSTTLTLQYSVDSATGKQMLNVNVVDSASGYPNNYEPFFQFGSPNRKINSDMYAGVASPNLTRGFAFVAPRSMNVGSIGIYLKGEPSPSGALNVKLALKNMTSGVVGATAETVANATNFAGINSGGIYTLPLMAPMPIVGGNIYVIYLELKMTNSANLSTLSGLTFAEICGTSSTVVQLENGVYSQYSSQNFDGYGDVGYSDVACVPYMFIQE